ncbi:hypothetical protein [Streptomyces sp. Wb2n-11]|uniref:hypothetical protein n=1 Tax=Streptomyces sp. Wb2n-11 TaxID=1030533 RepID=UPI000ABF7BFB|nr:hypothetical protein [Streptomyces sp. Wb2n-11]
MEQSRQQLEEATPAGFDEPGRRELLRLLGGVGAGRCPQAREEVRSAAQACATDSAPGGFAPSGERGPGSGA